MGKGFTSKDATSNSPGSHGSSVGPGKVSGASVVSAQGPGKTRGAGKRNPELGVVAGASGFKPKGMKVYREGS